MTKKQRDSISEDLGLIPANEENPKNENPLVLQHQMLRLPMDKPVYHKMVFRNHYNSLPDPGEINLKPSETIPDQTLSIPDLIQRAKLGLDQTDSRTPIYEGEDDLLDGIDIRSLDISERYDLMRANADELIELRKELQEKQKAKEHAKYKENVRKEIEMETNHNSISKTENPPQDSQNK